MQAVDRNELSDVVTDPCLQLDALICIMRHQCLRDLFWNKTTDAPAFTSPYSGARFRAQITRANHRVVGMNLEQLMIMPLCRQQY